MYSSEISNLDRRSTIIPWRGSRAASLWRKKNTNLILPIRSTNDLRTFCNRSDLESTRIIRVASNNKYSGFGTSVIAKLVKSNVKRNLFFTIKDRVVEEQVINGVTHRRQQKVKVYGFDSSKNARAELYDLVSDRVSYHKDKVIDPRIHEELCALKMDVKGRIDHPVGGHDDLVIAWALALYVLYRGGDIANEFGITRHQFKTDADLDEEIYDVQNDAEVISDKLEIVENDAETEDQIQYLKSGPGNTTFDDWAKSEFAREQSAMQKILATKAGREAYIRDNHLDATEFGDNTITQLPDDVFTNFYDDGNQMEQQSTGRGNLFSQFMKVMNAR